MGLRNPPTRRGVYERPSLGPSRRGPREKEAHDQDHQEEKRRKEERKKEREEEGRKKERKDKIKRVFGRGSALLPNKKKQMRIHEWKIHSCIHIRLEASPRPREKLAISSREK